MKLYALSLLLMSLVSLPALAELDVSKAYVRGLPPGVENTSAYMTLSNHSDDIVVLTGASSPVARTVMLHTTMNHDGMMQMQHVEAAPIPAGGELEMVSGGMHLMLMGLKRHPVTGDTVEVTLHFSDDSTQTIFLPVRSVLDE